MRSAIEELISSYQDAIGLSECEITDNARAELLQLRAQAARVEALEAAITKAISSLITIGNDLNWPAWLPMTYADTINNLRDVEHAPEQGGGEG